MRLQRKSIVNVCYFTTYKNNTTITNRKFGVKDKMLDFLNPQSIQIGVEGKTKEEIILELVNLLAKSGTVSNKEKVIASILKREQTMTTGIGNGVALPHGKSDGMEKLSAALCVSPEGVEFDSLDKKPVTIIVLLATPPGPGGPHIKALSQISRMLNNSSFREILISCKTPQELYDAIFNKK